MERYGEMMTSFFEAEDSGDGTIFLFLLGEVFWSDIRRGEMRITSSESDVSI